MNLSYLKYAVEVEKTGSITKAAQNFYMNQPHLSKIIRELERDLGEAIFDRTSRGMIPTKKGEEFLRYARTIMAQEEQIEALCTRNRESALEFRFCGPRATYIACAFTEFLCSTDTRFAVNIHYMETNSKNVIRLVSSKEFDLGIVRCQSVYEPYYQKLFQEENLESSLLWEFSSRLLMSADHPLAKKTGLTYLDLNDSIEILQGIPRILPSPLKLRLFLPPAVIPGAVSLSMTGAASSPCCAGFQEPICGPPPFPTGSLPRRASSSAPAPIPEICTGIFSSAAEAAA